MKKIILCCFLSVLMVFCCFSSHTLAQSTSDDASNFVFHDFGGFGVSVSIDQPIYWTDFMPPFGGPPTIRMMLRVFNDSHIPVTLDFTTSQRFDFSIYNSAGVEVWRWSDDKAFLQVIGQVTLQPGQSRNYRAARIFVDQNGSILPEGLFTLKGELTATDFALWLPRTMESTVSFWHVYVY